MTSTNIENLEKRIEKLEKKNKEKGKQDAWNKLLMKTIFYGAVASGITAICGLIQFLMSFFREKK